MAIGTDSSFEQEQTRTHVKEIVRPVQIECKWDTMIDAGGPNTQDASTITDPDAEITNSTSHIFAIKGRGTTLRLRLMYDDGISSVTSPIINVFGRFSSDEVWQRLQNKSGDTNVTLTVDTTNDVSDGTFNFTLVDADDHAFDLDGCAQVLVGIKTALAATGTVTTATIQGKVI